MSRRLVAARLITLIHLLYQSAGPAYRSLTGLTDFEWRVMTQVGDHGPITLTALAALLGQDKGQLSHAVQSMVRSKLLTRGQLRGPIMLTKHGQAVFDRLVKLSWSRNTALIKELTEAERRAVSPLLLKLRTNAQSLLARENSRKGVPEETESGTPVSRPTLQQQVARKAGSKQRLIAQDLFALHGLLQRSAAITYRRETGLSDFEWRVLSQVGEHAPLTLIQLVPLLSRDKSQVGRTLTQLEAKGLVTREKIGGGRHVLVGISDRGRQVYARLAELAIARNSSLVTGLDRREQQTLMGIFDKLTANARSMLT